VVPLNLVLHDYSADDQALSLALVYWLSFDSDSSFLVFAVVMVLGLTLELLLLLPAEVLPLLVVHVLGPTLASWVESLGQSHS